MESEAAKDHSPPLPDPAATARIAQLDLAPETQASVSEVTEIGTSERGAGGFGSTGTGGALA